MRRDNPDGNAKALYENLEKEKAGWVCQRITRAVEREKGIPDAIVARKGDVRRRNHLLEVKKLGGQLTQEQRDFAKAWPGCVHVATSSWEANLLLTECEQAHSGPALPQVLNA